MSEQTSLKHSAFTQRYQGVTRQIMTNVTVVRENHSYQTSHALWDTGATNTCISNAVVQRLGLIATGRREIHTPSGSKTVNTYLVDVILPNHVSVKDAVVFDSDIGEQNLDVLIGMDIISLGDFTISQHGGYTTFSFCTPPIKQTDYVVQIKATNLMGRTHGKGKRKRK